MPEKPESPEEKPYRFCPAIMHFLHAAYLSIVAKKKHCKNCDYSTKKGACNYPLKGGGK